MPNLKKELPEDQLIQAIKNKTRIGSKALYDMYAHTLFGVILKILHNNEAAEDALQSSMIKIWNNFHLYDPSKGRLFTWMISISKNVALDELRSKYYGQSLKTANIDCHLKYLEGINYEIINTDIIGVRMWLNILTIEQKNVFNLIYIQGYSHSEAAKQIGIPIGSLKTRWRIGLQSLRNVYASSKETGRIKLLAS